MPSSWIVARPTPGGRKRYLVRFRLGGRESSQRYAGSFRTRVEAVERRRWVDGELAAMRVPDLSLLDGKRDNTPTLAEAAAAYRDSRIDIAEATRVNIGTALNLILGLLGAGRRVESFTAQEIADAVSQLHASGYKRETIRKAVTHLACVFDFAGVEPNPVRDKLRVRRARTAIRMRVSSPRAALTRSGRASRRPAARPASRCGRRMISATDGSASSTGRGGRGRRSARSWASVH